MTRVAAPLEEEQAFWIRPLGLLADSPEGLRGAWRSIEEMWDATVADARGLPAGMLDQRVGDGWSFLEHLRHLVFVTDSWLRDAVLDEPAPYDPIGMPPDFITNGAELGLDPDAHPSLDEVLGVRAGRVAQVRGFLGGITDEALDQPCDTAGGTFTVLGALQNVVFEEWAHHHYATRDLAQLR